MVYSTPENSTGNVDIGASTSPFEIGFIELGSIKRLARIRFLPPGQTDLTTMVHYKLIEHANQGRKHKTELLYELALCWRRYLRDGEFGVSTEMLNERYGSRFREKLIAILNDTTTVTKRHSSYPGTSRCKMRVFKFEGKKCATYSGIPGSFRMSFDPAAMRSVTIPGSWLWDRYERWSAICVRLGWQQQLDLDGRTEWGVAIHAALESITVPLSDDTRRLTHYGVVNIKRRKHGRMYHCLTNLSKVLRRASEIDGERLVEIDLHACYTLLLVEKLPDGEAKDRAIAVLQSDWYSQFEGAYQQWLVTKREEGIAYQNADGVWMLRADDDPANDVKASIKVEYQRQCLFWRDNRARSNPLREALRRLHPELCQLVEDFRSRLTPTELSHVLTRGEGSMMVDSALPELQHRGIMAVGIHDAVVVPESKAAQAYETLIQVAEWHLGFRPRISLK
jgi:hypothetical protein